MSQLPVWAQWMQLIATGAIAFVATFIGYRQWRTAHEKVMLDLFERRMAVYDATRHVIGQIVRDGTADNKTFYEYLRATDRLKLLFGDDVVAYAEETRQRINKIVYHEKMIAALIDKPDQANAYQEHVHASSDLFEKVIKFYDEFSTLALPYVRMTQKRTWW